MTTPPSEPISSRPRPGRHAHRAATRSFGLTRIMQTTELPAGVNALASADGKTVVVRAGLDKATRRSAIRQVLAATHRFPSLALYPALADARIRRFIAEAADAATSFSQHVAGFVGANPAATALATVATVATVGVATAGVVTGLSPWSPHPGADAGRTRPAAGSPTAPIKIDPLERRPASYLGVWERSAPQTYADVVAFGTAIGHAPNIAGYYSGWDETFRAGWAGQAAASGATPCVQIDPAGVSLAAIAAGKQDAYLTSFARAVHGYGRSVIIGFAHEMNANWYSWGNGHTPAAVFIAAWRHVVDLFRSQGDTNVTWLWTVNVNAPRTGPIDAWWPGAAYVTWVGIDGYFAHPTDTFSSVFAPTINDVLALTRQSRPILLSETAAPPPGSARAAQIASLFAGIKYHQILGFVWFDVAQSGGLYRQDWRIEGDQAAMSEFRRESRRYSW